MSVFITVLALSVFLIQFIVSLICLFLYTRTHERFLRSWALAFSFGSARFGIDTIANAFGPNTFLNILFTLFGLLNILFVLYGALELKNLKTSRIISFALTLLILWTVWSYIDNSLTAFVKLLPVSLIGAAVYVWAGVVFYIHKPSGIGRYLVAVPLVIVGAVKVLAPFAYVFNWFIITNYLLGFFLAVIMSLGFLVYYFQAFFLQFVRTNNFFRIIGERSDDIVFHFKTSPLKRFEFISPSVRNITGFYPDDFYKNNSLLFELIIPEDKGKLLKLLRSKRNEPEIIRMKTPAGEVKCLEVNIFSERGKNGKVISIDGVARDITGSINFKRMLAESEEKYRLLFEFSTANVLVVKAEDGVIWDANTNACEFYGFSKEELKNRKIYDLNITQGYEGYKALAAMTIRDHHAHFFSKHLLSSGETRDIEVYTSAVEFNNAHFIYAVIHDITEEYRAREALAESEKLYRHKLEETVKERTLELKKSEDMFRKVAENSQDSIILFNRNLDIIYVNPTVELRNPHLNKEKVLKYVPESVLPEDIEEQIKDLFNRIVITRKDDRKELNMRDGRVIEFISTPLFNQETGEVDMLLSYGRDVTERKKLEDTIVASLERERELNNMKSRLISTVSHEFRTPMAAILSSAELLERYGRKWDAEKYNEHFSRIRFSVNNLTSLVDDVLTLGRVESRRIDFNPIESDLGELCDNLLQEIYMLASDKHEIKTEFNTLQKNYMLDERLFRLIFLNLLSNAVKYSPDGGEICFTVNENAGYLNFVVKDSGIGIPQENHKSLFEPFSRGSNVKEIPGTGLGLSIVKLAVEACQGNIQLNSEIKKGTTVIVNLPIIPGT
jgi:PAS domain S-box-containing protein